MQAIRSVFVALLAIAAMAIGAGGSVAREAGTDARDATSRSDRMTSKPARAATARSSRGHVWATRVHRPDLGVHHVSYVVRRPNQTIHHDMSHEMRRMRGHRHQRCE